MSMLDRVDGINIRTMDPEIVSQPPDRFSLTAFGDEQHGTALGVGGQGDIVVAAGARGLVDGQAGDLGEVGLGQREIDIAPAHRRHPMPALAGETCHRRKRHLARQHQHQCLKEQREARELPGPARLDLAHRATRQLHAGYADLQVALVLEEIEVPITLADRIVHRMDASLTSHSEPAASSEVDAYGQSLCRRVQVNGCHMPRLGNAQGCFKKPVVHPDPIDYQ